MQRAMRHPFLSYFNPTLVRLRPNCRRWTIHDECHFNPTLVRLRREKGRPVMVRFVNFNPTLVRLRLSQSVPPGEPAPVFQSHAGSIEAPKAF